ncbi:MAG TPA: MFS transporter [Chloroflexota bacterium]|nr:MFS transporter [Chloroflexota bacterium]
MPPAEDDQPSDRAREAEPVVDAVPREPPLDSVLRDPPLDSVLLERSPAADVASLSMALGGTFLLRCASQAAGFLIAVSLGIRSREELNLTAGIASLVFVTFYASELIGAPLFGAWSDRSGRKPFMLLGPVFGAIAAQLLGLTMVIPILVLVRVLQGLSTATSAPATLGFLSGQTATSEKLRGRVMGLYEAATVVGIGLGAALGGKLHDQFGLFAFTLVALLYVGALVPFVFVRDRVWVPRVRIAHGNLLTRMLNRRIMRFAPAWLAANAVLGAWFNVGTFLASGAENRGQFLMRGFSPGEIGTASAAFGVLFAVGAIAWGFVMPVIGRQATLLVGVGGLGFTSVALWALNQVPFDATHTRVPILVGLVMLGIFVESGFTPAALAYLAEIAEERAEDRGSVMGVYSVLLGVGQLLGVALAAPFADAQFHGQRLGINGLIIFTGLLCLVALFTVMLLGHAERRHVRLAAV